MCRSAVSSGQLSFQSQPPDVVPDGAPDDAVVVGEAAGLAVPRRFAAGVTGAGVSSGDADVDVAVVDVRGDDVIDGIGPTFLPVATGLGVDDTVAIQVDRG